MTHGGLRVKIKNLFYPDVGSVKYPDQESLVTNVKKDLNGFYSDSGLLPFIMFSSAS